MCQIARGRATRSASPKADNGAATPVQQRPLADFAKTVPKPGFLQAGILQLFARSRVEVRWLAWCKIGRDMCSEYLTHKP